MSQITGHALYRKFENVGTKEFPRLIRRAVTLPTESKPHKPSLKTRIKNVAKEKIENAGGTYLNYNFKKGICHFLDRGGNRKSISVFTGITRKI